MTASALQKHIHSLNGTGFFHMDAARVSLAELTTHCLRVSSSKQSFLLGTSEEFVSVRFFALLGDV